MKFDRFCKENFDEDLEESEEVFEEPARRKRIKIMKPKTSPDNGN